MKYIKSRTYPNLTLSIKFPIAPEASNIQVMYTGVYFMINGILRTTYVVLKMPLIIKYTPVYITCILLASGAIGNFIDRVRFGYVRDFIYFKIINFPVFNLADCYVTVSVIIFIILILFVYKNEDDFAFLSLKK